MWEQGGPRAMQAVVMGLVWQSLHGHTRGGCEQLAWEGLGPVTGCHAAGDRRLLMGMG